MYLNSTMSTIGNVAELFVILIIFLGILCMAYFVSRWIGTAGMKQQNDRNIRVIEGCRVGQNKIIQIVKVGNRFIVVGIGKDEISYLGEVEEKELTILNNEMKPLPEFKDILAKVKKKNPTKEKNE